MRRGKRWSFLFRLAMPRQMGSQARIFSQSQQQGNGGKSGQNRVVQSMGLRQRWTISMPHLLKRLMVRFYITFLKAEPGAHLACRLRTLSPPWPQGPPIPARSDRLKPLFRICVLFRRTSPAGPHWGGRKHLRQEKRKRRKRERGLESLDCPGCAEGHKWKGDWWRPGFLVRCVFIL